MNSFSVDSLSFSIPWMPLCSKKKTRKMQKHQRRRKKTLLKTIDWPHSTATAATIQSSSSETICLLDITKTCTLKASLMKIACLMCMEYGRGNQASNYNAMAFNWILQKNSGGSETTATFDELHWLHNNEIYFFFAVKILKVKILKRFFMFCANIFFLEKKFTCSPQQSERFCFKLIAPASAQVTKIWERMMRGIHFTDAAHTSLHHKNFKTSAKKHSERLKKAQIHF